MKKKNIKKELTKARKFKNATPGQNRDFETLDANRMFKAYEDVEIDEKTADWKKDDKEHHRQEFGPGRKHGGVSGKFGSPGTFNMTSRQGVGAAAHRKARSVKKVRGAKEEVEMDEQLPLGHRQPSPGSDSTASYARLQDAKRKAKAAGKDYDRLPYGDQQKYHEDAPTTSTAGVANWNPVLGGKRPRVVYKKRRNVDGRTKDYKETVTRLQARRDASAARELEQKLNMFGVQSNPFREDTQMENKKYLKTKEGSIEDAVLQSVRSEALVNPNDARPTLHLPKKYLESKGNSLESAVADVMVSETISGNMQRDLKVLDGHRFLQKYRMSKANAQRSGGGIQRLVPKGARGPASDERQEAAHDDVDAYDYKAKKGAIAAPGSGSIAKAQKAKSSDVNKSIEQQMADARKEEVEMEGTSVKNWTKNLPDKKTGEAKDKMAAPPGNLRPYGAALKGGKSKIPNVAVSEEDIDESWKKVKPTDRVQKLDQLSISGWLSKQMGRKGDPHRFNHRVPGIYFDDVDLVVNDKTVVPKALSSNVTMADLLKKVQAHAKKNRLRWESVEIDELTVDQKKKREASRERTHSGHKSYRQAHDADRGQKKPDRNVRKYWERPSSMRAGPKGKLPEDVEIDEAKPTSKQVKMAKGIAWDKRHKGGDMTGAWKKAEKIKKGLGDHPKVQSALRKANEEDDRGVGSKGYTEYVRNLTPGETAVKDPEAAKASSASKQASAEKKRQVTKIDDAVDPEVVAARATYKKGNQDMKKQHILDVAKIKASKVGEEVIVGLLEMGIIQVKENTETGFEVINDPVANRENLLRMAYNTGAKILDEKKVSSDDYDHATALYKDQWKDRKIADYDKEHGRGSRAKEMRKDAEVDRKRMWAMTGDKWKHAKGSSGEVKGKKSEVGNPDPKDAYKKEDVKMKGASFSGTPNMTHDPKMGQTVAKSPLKDKETDVKEPKASSTKSLQDKQRKTAPPGSTSEDYHERLMDEAGKWIQKAIKKPGALHRDLGVPQDEKIPKNKIKAAAKEGGKVGQRARLAMTLGKMNK